MKSSLGLAGVPLSLSVAMPLVGGVARLRVRGSPFVSLSFARILILMGVSSLVVAISLLTVGGLLAELSESGILKLIDSPVAKKPLFSIPPDNKPCSVPTCT